MAYLFIFRLNYDMAKQKEEMSMRLDSSEHRLKALEKNTEVKETGTLSCHLNL